MYPFYGRLACQAITEITIVPIINAKAAATKSSHLNRPCCIYRINKNIGAETATAEIHITLLLVPKSFFESLPLSILVSRMGE